MAKIKGLLFDKDGTLFDFHATWGVWCAGFIADVSEGDGAVASALAKAMDYDLENSAFLPSSVMIADSMDGIMDAVHSALPHWERGALMEYVVETASNAPQAPVTDLGPLLARFRASGLKIGLATNDNEAPARAHLTSVSVLEHFDFISGCDTGFGAKPEPGMLLGFADAMGLQPSEVAMIGDSTHDLRAGRAAGMVNIGVLTGPAVFGDLAPFADVVLRDIGEIPEWLGLD
ncbi:MAG: HAD family hydrolase [Rhodobacteraceae bacterium]|nr:HAD family hydrolase [Paracoccaceae bacterium]